MWREVGDACGPLGAQCLLQSLCPYSHTLYMSSPSQAPVCLVLVCGVTFRLGATPSAASR